MKYYSTRDTGRRSPCGLDEAAFMGLAPDGGLFVPERIPQVDMERVAQLAEHSYADMAAYVAAAIMDDMDPDMLSGAVHAAYDFPISLHEVGDGLYTLELFHGPTFAFKDFGARFMGRVAGVLNGGRQLTVLAATSGDTGSAVAHGFSGVEGVRVVILYPEGKVSPLQEAQMTTLGGNIHPLRVDGTFDDCQRLVKEMFGDEALRCRVRITSANSINLLRWLPQSFYYFYGWAAWRRATGRDEPDVVVPSGNYGNLAAGMLARRMGLPVRRFVAASNANDVVPEFLRTGVYRPRPSVRTVANAMDVGAPSNFERMLWLCGGDPEALRRELCGFSCGDDDILSLMGEMYARYGYLSDPHSAVGYGAARALGADGFWLSTAHAAKFGDAVRRATGAEAPLPPALDAMMHRERHSRPMAADAVALREFLMSLG